MVLHNTNDLICGQVELGMASWQCHCQYFTVDAANTLQLMLPILCSWCILSWQNPNSFGSSGTSLAIFGWSLKQKDYSIVFRHSCLLVYDNVICVVDNALFVLLSIDTDFDEKFTCIHVSFLFVKPCVIFVFIHFWILAWLQSHLFSFLFKLSKTCP